MNYSELIAEVADRTQSPGFASRGGQYTTQAETELAQHFTPPEYPPFNSIITDGTNWLLHSDQEIYLAAILKQFYLATLDAEKAAAANLYMTGLIDAKKTSERVVRYSGEKRVIGGYTP